MVPQNCTLSSGQQRVPPHGETTKSECMEIYGDNPMFHLIYDLSHHFPCIQSADAKMQEHLCSHPDCIF